MTGLVSALFAAEGGIAFKRWGLAGRMADQGSCL